MASPFMTGPFVPVAMLNLIRAVLGIHHHRFNLSVKRSSNHAVEWIALHKGKVAASAVMDKGELAVFDESNGALEFEALEDTGFVLGSAVKHPYSLVLGSYSVHTSEDALDRGEARIGEFGKRLRAEGRL